MRVLFLSLFYCFICICSVKASEVFFPMSSTKKTIVIKDTLFFPNHIFPTYKGEKRIKDIFEKNELTIIVNGFSVKPISYISKIRNEIQNERVKYLALLYYNIESGSVEQERHKLSELAKRNNLTVDYPVIFDGLYRRKRKEGSKDINITNDFYRQLYESKQFEKINCKGGCFPTFLLVNSDAEIVYAQNGGSILDIKAAVKSYFDSNH